MIWLGKVILAGQAIDPRSLPRIDLMAQPEPKTRPIRDGLQNIMLRDVPSFANKFFYSLGFLSAISFLLLALTGLVMAAAGPHWWITNTFGQYTRSFHLWSTQAFVVFILLHLIIVFLTSGFLGARKLTWVLGVIMLLLALAEAEFGYVLRGDFSSQYRSLQGADLYNGSVIVNFSCQSYRKQTLLYNSLLFRV